MLSVLDFSYSTMCVMVLIVVLSLHLLICHLYIFFGEVSFKVLTNFFYQVVFLLLSFKSILYILNNISLSHESYKYFLPVCGLSSHSLNIVSHRSEVFNFNTVQLINFFFHELCFHGISKNYCDI